MRIIALRPLRANLVMNSAEYDESRGEEVIQVRKKIASEFLQEIAEIGVASHDSFCYAQSLAHHS
jgi:hypothetical protein